MYRAGRGIPALYYLVATIMNRKKSGSSAVKSQTKPKRTLTTRKKGGRGVLPLSLPIMSRTVWIVALMLLTVFIYCIYYFFIGPYSFRWKAIYREPIYPEGYNIRGIDISHYQDEIQWEKLRNASLNNDPVRFVIIKATEGMSLMDNNFNENFYQAKQNGFVRGAYHFFVPEIDAAQQARFFLHQVHLEPGDLPPVLDVEKRGKLSKEELQKAVKKWLNIVEKHYGVKPILYTGYKFHKDVLHNPDLQQYPFWIAHYYVEKLKYKGPWIMWQHTDCGRVDGIRGYVDCNIFNGGLQDLMDLTLKENESMVE